MKDRLSSVLSIVSTVYVPAGCTPSTSVSEKGRRKVIVVNVVRSGKVIAPFCRASLIWASYAASEEVGLDQWRKNDDRDGNIGALLPTITAAIRATTIAKTVVTATATAAS
jgi:hypothetical protein